MTAREATGIAALALLVLACYVQVAGHTFIWDTTHIFEPEAMREFSLASIGWAFSNTVIANWHPLSLITHQLDWALYGESSGGHHITNVLLHLAVSVVVFLLVREMADGRAPEASVLALLVALVFALHPLRVESVAWVAARKDLLYSLFYLLAALFYVRTGRVTLAVIACFAASLLSKSMAVTLPAVLVLLDLCPLGRLSLDRTFWPTLLRRVTEKWVLWLMSVAVILVTLATQDNAMAVQLSRLEQLGNAVHNTIFYLQQFVVPVGLSPFYPFESVAERTAWQYWLLPGVILLALAVAALSCALRGQPLYLTCLGLYLVMLLPASGLVHVGSSAAADRYTYLPLLPANFLLALGIVTAWRQFVPLRRVLGLVAVLLVLTLGALTFMQARHWQNPVTFWSQVLRHYPGAALAHRNIATAFLSIGERERAASHLVILVIDGWPMTEELVAVVLAADEPLAYAAEIERIAAGQGLQANAVAALNAVVARIRASVAP